MNQLALFIATFAVLCFGFFIPDKSLKASEFVVFKTYTTLESLVQDGTRAIGEVASLDVRVVSVENFEVSARAMDASGMEWTLRLRAPRLIPAQLDLLNRTNHVKVRFLVTNVQEGQRLIEGTLYSITA